MNIGEYIDKHIDICQEEKKKLGDKIQKLYDARWVLHDPVNTFKCPEGLDKKDAICVGCDKALPEPWVTRIDGKDTIVFSYPGNHQENNFVDSNRYCQEWKIKRHTSACGCGGSFYCECGHSQPYCSPPNNYVCPYCGRIPEWSPSGMYKQMMETLESVLGDNVELQKC